MVLNCHEHRIEKDKANDQPVESLWLNYVANFKPKIIQQKSVRNV